jgi:hypothetical protein
MVLCDMLWFFRNQAVHNGIIRDAIKLAANMKRVLWTIMLLGAHYLILLESIGSLPMQDITKSTLSQSLKIDSRLKLLFAETQKKNYQGYLPNQPLGLM